MTTSIFFKTNQKFPKSVEPRKTSFNYPSPCFEFRVPAFFFNFLASLSDARDVFSFKTLFHCWFSRISFVRAQMLPSSHWSFWPLNNDAIQGNLQQFYIMRLSSADDEGQRDSTAVDENASLAPIFSPDLLDFVRQSQEQEELCSFRRQCFAIARQYPPSRRIQPAPTSRAFRKNQPSAIQENIDELRSGCQNHAWTRLSIVFQYAIHGRFPQKRSEGKSVYGHHQHHERISGDDHVSYMVLMVLLSPRIRPKSPMNRAFVCLVLPWYKYHLSQSSVSILFMDKF
jgi:hypothetical protein